MASELRWIGGDPEHRSLLGGHQPPWRIGVAVVFGVVAVSLVPSFGWWPLLVGIVVVAVWWFITMNTHRGTIFDRWKAQRRWRARAAAGDDVYQPFSDEAWEAGVERVRTTRGRDRAEARRELHTLRAMPDGADGMGWLQSGIGEPGIAWHAPLGEEARLTVAFEVDGQLHGIESDARLNRASAAFGRFLANRAAPASLVRSVQLLTRVLPADTAFHQRWVSDNLTDDDDETAQQVLRSYAQVIERSSADAMVQRHFAVITWPLTAAFQDRARRYGAELDGWRSLMAAEIDSVRRGLRDAGLGAPRALSAREVGAVILHQQAPSRPIDQAGDVHPLRIGVASHDEMSAHVVDEREPNGLTTQWWHRTARIVPSGMVNQPRHQLWALPLLTGRDLPFMRSVSFHMNLVPAGPALAQAELDHTIAGAATYRKRKAGTTVIGQDISTSSAERRVADLQAGTGHQGVEWAAYVTITARSRDGLAQASQQLTEVCATALGVPRLEWLDSYQSAASGLTWPIGRGLAAPSDTFAVRMLRSAAGRESKEAL